MTRETKLKIWELLVKDGYDVRWGDINSLSKEITKLTETKIKDRG